ncbi:DUF4238 domain-containing protein [uncultured Senegalimassilia sp.]|uniref:DUF4238 domain-containing protein n=1 Tax=uncultured Senegalimassilia sp. TaxID=1714350 RepID=UPI0025D950C3|nr:DUF4238 domain-containing protein [uncultured Senegalimassilia sp.]
MANLTKRQHYVPQFYLKNFCDSTGFLWGWDKLKKGIFKCATKDICQSAFLYENELKNANPKCGKFILPNSIENTLANMEGEFSTCISQVLQICRNPANRDVLICSSKQKQILTKFAINMMLRNPVMLNGAYDGEYKSSAYSDLVDTGYEELVDLMGFGDLEPFFDYALKLGLIDEKIKNSPANVFNSLISEMQFEILKANGYSFVTANCPVIFVGGHTSEENLLDYLSIPISPDFTLSYTREKLTRRNKIVELSPKETLDINLQYADSTAKLATQLYSNDKELLSFISAYAK